MKTIKILLLLGIIGIVAAGTVIYSGIYPMGADVPHNKFTYWILEQVRENSIERAAKDINVPDLKSPELLLSGGADYNDMCASCHLKPGQKDSDLSLGLYPQPPNLSLADHGGEHDSDDEEDETLETQKMFWTIKHGIKASAMPAWGIGHDDDRIWAMVAFIKKMPELTEDQYQVLTARN
jgi:mono/diheme cytochrome c family protein